MFSIRVFVASKVGEFCSLSLSLVLARYRNVGAKTPRNALTLEALTLPPSAPSRILDSCKRRPARCAIQINSNVFAEDAALALSKKGYAEDPKTRRSSAVGEY